MRAYRVLQWLLRVACQVFFRRVEVVGLGEVPPGAVVFCGNHPNSLLDPVLITAFCGRVVHFAAKDTLFDNPVVRAALETMGAVPIRRRMDHGDRPIDNQGAFDALIDVLGRGRAIGIFPEGISHDQSQLAPLKTGAARIALSVKERWPDRPLHLVPTGLIYLTRHRFRSSVLIQFGAPIAVPRSVGDGDRAAVAELTGEIDRRLRGLTINAESWDTVQVLDGVRRLYQPPDLSLEERVEYSRRFNAAYPTVRRRPEVAAIIGRVRAYQQRASAIEVSDELIKSGVSVRQTIRRVIGHLALILFWSPLFLVGAPIHAPLGLALKLFAGRVAPRSDTVATTKFVLGLLAVLLVYAGIAAAVAIGLGWRWGLLAVMVLPLSGHAFIRVIGRIDALRHLFMTTARVACFGREIEALRAERGELEVAVIRAVDRLRAEDPAIGTA